MDPNRALDTIMTALLGGGGVVGVLAAMRAYKSRAHGTPADESEAMLETAPGATADLIRYWKAEIRAVRLEYALYRRQAEKLHRWYEYRIDELEQWIWQNKPPPPPKARPRDEDDED